MAYKKQVELESGINLPEAYLRVEQVSLETKDSIMAFAFVIYANEQARVDGKESLGTYHFIRIPCNKTGNLVEQAYDYINSQLVIETGDTQIKNLFTGVVSV